MPWPDQKGVQYKLHPNTCSYSVPGIGSNMQLPEAPTYSKSRNKFTKQLVLKYSKGHVSARGGDATFSVFKPPEAPPEACAGCLVCSCLGGTLVRKTIQWPKAERGEV